MPSVSKKQADFMRAVAHSPEFAKKVGVPQSVGKDFSNADKGRKFAKGGEMAESKKMIGKEIAFMKKKGAPKSMLKHEESEMAAMKKGGKVKKMAAGGDTTGMGANKQSRGMTMEKMGKVKTAAPSRDGVAIKGHTKGKMVKMAYGGKAC